MNKNPVRVQTHTGWTRLGLYEEREIRLGYIAQELNGTRDSNAVITTNERWRRVCSQVTQTHRV